MRRALTTVCCLLSYGKVAVIAFTLSHFIVCGIEQILFLQQTLEVS